MLQNTGLTTGGALKKGTSSNPLGSVFLIWEYRVQITKSRVKTPLLLKKCLVAKKDTYSNQRKTYD